MHAITRRDKGPLDGTSLLGGPALPRDRTAEATGSCRSAPPRYRTRLATFRPSSTTRIRMAVSGPPYPRRARQTEHPAGTKVPCRWRRLCDTLAPQKVPMSRLRFVMLAVGWLFLQGCASMSAPATPVTSIDPLVGKWSGTVTIGQSVGFFYLTINPDRTLIAIWGDITSRGTVSVANGQAAYQMQPP